MSGLLTNKTALVTNVSTKLGYAIAQRLGFAGANVFISDAHDQKLRKSVHGLKELGLNVAGAVVDVTDPKHREQLFEEVDKKFNGLDVLVVNPLVNTQKGAILDSTKMDFDKTYNQILTTPFKLAKSAVPLLEKSSNGSIVFISSIAGFSPFEDIGLYSAAQTGLLGLVKASAISLAQRKIRVNSVSLGMMRDDASGGFWTTADDDQLAQLSQVIPLGRVAKNTDSTALIEFLASDRASYITGENCIVNDEDHSASGQLVPSSTPDFGGRIHGQKRLGAGTREKGVQNRRRSRYHRERRN
uniref:NAD(P)-binding protein n=1 Tax=Panagrellus redivivus TaxID=6233 RepID=A0A7E4WBK3_PANRE